LLSLIQDISRDLDLPPFSKTFQFRPLVVRLMDLRFADCPFPPSLDPLTPKPVFRLLFLLVPPSPPSCTSHAEGGGRRLFLPLFLFVPLPPKHRALCNPVFTSSPLACLLQRIGKRFYYRAFFLFLVTPFKLSHSRPHPTVFSFPNPYLCASRVKGILLLFYPSFFLFPLESVFFAILSGDTRPIGAAPPPFELGMYGHSGCRDFSFLSSVDPFLPFFL